MAGKCYVVVLVVGILWGTVPYIVAGREIKDVTTVTIDVDSDIDLVSYVTVYGWRQTANEGVHT